MKTFIPKDDPSAKSWFVVDASEKILGRLAVKVATVLRGKHKAEYSPSVDMGDFVVIVNAGKIAVTGNKLLDKKYYKHTGYPGGISDISLGKLLETKPEEALKKAIRGMLPKGSLGRKMLSKLKVYDTETHPHESQNPQPFPSA
ncbi:MAG: 50S ribosomal protein L13 [Deltaproteobacteria bacterium]|nr:50S ribosomal protein L13 [Deltaproteobacteria bacterium]